MGLATEQCSPRRSQLIDLDIRYAIDGDSVKLTNGQELRIVGINTPEHGEFLAQEARQVLRQTIHSKNTKVQTYITQGRDKRDSYGRILADLWVLNDDGSWTSPAIKLLEKGLAFHIAISPNLQYVACYAAAEQRARKAKKALWSNGKWRPIDASNKRIKRGFAFIKGDIVEIIDKGRFGSELVMSGGRLGLWIPAKSYKLFGGKNKLKLWLDKEIVVRGWIYKYKNNPRLQLSVSHPSMLDLH